MKGWVGLVGWSVADGSPTLVVTHQLQVERRTGKVRQSETDVLPLCYATNRCVSSKSKSQHRGHDTLHALCKVCMFQTATRPWFSTSTYINHFAILGRVHCQTHSALTFWDSTVYTVASSSVKALKRREYQSINLLGNKGPKATYQSQNTICNNYCPR